MADTREFTSASFNNFLREKRLMASGCSRCGRLYLPPRPLCTSCYSRELGWVELSGRGTLRAFTVIAVGPSFMVEAGYDRTNHYCSGIVRLEEGPCISALIRGVDVKHPDAISIGIPLQLDLLTVGTGGSEKTLLAFRKAD